MSGQQQRFGTHGCVTSDLLAEGIETQGRLPATGERNVVMGGHF